MRRGCIAFHKGPDNCGGGTSLKNNDVDIGTINESRGDSVTGRLHMPSCGLVLTRD